MNMPGPFEGWLVGWVERADEAPVTYALFVRGPSHVSIAQFRGRMTRSFPRRSGAWPDARQ